MISFLWATSNKWKFLVVRTKGGKGLVTNLIFLSKNNFLLHLFDPEAFKTCINTIKLPCLRFIKDRPSCFIKTHYNISGIIEKKNFLIWLISFPFEAILSQTKLFSQKVDFWKVFDIVVPTTQNYHYFISTLFRHLR